jgi:DNA-binding transcriptional LysR family regulator
MIDIMKKHPRLNLQLLIDDTDARISRLKKGEIDIAIVPPEFVENEFESRRLPADEYVLLCCSAWKGRSLEDILSTERLYSFLPSDYTSMNYLRTFNLEKHLKRSRLHANENRTLAAMLCGGVGFGILEKTIASEYIQQGKLILLNNGKSMKDPIAACWSPRRIMADYFNDVISALSSNPK